MKLLGPRYNDFFILQTPHSTAKLHVNDQKKNLTKLTSAIAHGSAVTIGNFDGVHLGHSALLTKFCTTATKLQLPTLLLLFEPQPAEYFYGPKAPPRLTSLREKLNKLQKYQLDYIICVKFNKKIALMPAHLFAKLYLFSLLHVKYILVGEDFHFGFKRLGDANLLQEMGQPYTCRLEIFPNFFFAKIRVSSTKIRNLLAQGELMQASTLLGREFSICGKVHKGKGRACKWQIPTANITLHRLTLPLGGVFAVIVKRLNGTLLPGIANIGKRPTFNELTNSLEVHLLDFNDNLYGERLEVFFLQKLRDEIKFFSIKSLINQIHLDLKVAETYFRDHPIATEYN